ncbi:glycosyltransferase family 2 protein [Neobacillus drentensis]|uniref:glycosyltransferase family 2 protein n=1 Tax=Neobacillus drentensis TaxID=220684 RepID=UPI0030010507
MRISVIVCCYNGAKYVEEQLSSIVNQTRMPDEIVINDDGSSDNTREILSKWKETTKVPVVLNFNTERLGYVKNFENALLRTTGDIIVFSDQDDFWYSNKLEIIEHEYKNDSSLDLIFTDADIVNSNLESKGYSLFESVGLNKRKISNINCGNAYQEFLKRNVVTGATMSIRKRVIELVTPFSAEWVHDAWISLIVSMVSKVKVLDQNLIKYRQHDFNQIGTTNNLSEKVKKALSTGDLSEKGAKQMVDLIEFINKKPGLNLSPFFQSKLEQKYLHFLKRTRLPKSLVKRIVPVFIELITLKYTFYSNGYKSALKDIIIIK